jgi:2-dehydropantoate 2-reductase
MRICIAGAGAVGGYLAARLARAGRAVSVLARGAHLDAIRSRGLTLHSGAETFTVEVAASDDPAELGSQDLVVVTAKHPSLPALAERMAPLLGPDTPVVFAMNGVLWFYGDGWEPSGGGMVAVPRLDPGGVLHREIGADRALGMIIYSPNTVTEPGVVHNEGTRNRFVLGDCRPGPSERARTAAAALDGAGFKLEVTDDLRRTMWGKLAVNLSTAPLCILTHATGADLVADADASHLVRRLVEETMAVAAAHGFDDIGADPEALSRPGSRPQHKPSILQDLELGRPMEIDAILVAVQDLARQAGVATPVLDTLLPLVTVRARMAGLYGLAPAATP